MNMSRLVVFTTLSLLSGLAQADKDHKNWVNIESMSMPIFRSAQQAQTQITKVGQMDTSSMAGQKASQLITQGRVLQNQILARQGKPLSQAQFDSLQSLIAQMDQTAAAAPAGGTQGACFSSCDDAYGSGFGQGKGWNRFWCKASCFKINVNVGGAKSANGIGSMSGGNTNTAQPPATIKAPPASGTPTAPVPTRTTK